MRFLFSHCCKQVCVSVRLFVSVWVCVCVCLPAFATASFLPICLDKHFLSVNTEEPGTPQFPDEYTLDKTYTQSSPFMLAHFHSSCSPSHANNCRHSSHILIHTQQQKQTCLLPHTYTHCYTNMSPSPLSFPPPIPFSGG